MKIKNDFFYEITKKMYKTFYISFSLIIIITLLLYNNNNDYSLNPIIEKINEELGKIKKFIKFKEQRIKEFDNLICNITILHNYLEKK